MLKELIATILTMSVVVALGASPSPTPSHSPHPLSSSDKLSILNRAHAKELARRAKEDAAYAAGVSYLKAHPSASH